LYPDTASPAAKVTACSSAIPTSKNLSGNSFWNLDNPVPSGIAAVIARILSFAFAILTNVFEKTSVYDIIPLVTVSRPVLMSKGLTP